MSSPKGESVIGYVQFFHNLKPCNHDFYTLSIANQQWLIWTTPFGEHSFGMAALIGDGYVAYSSDRNLSV